MKTLERNICQKCDTPIFKLADFGSNKDGIINTEYCRSCYSRGVFVDRGISLEEKIEKNIATLS
jgi:hypothetical protein